MCLRTGSPISLHQSSGATRIFKISASLEVSRGPEVVWNAGLDRRFASLPLLVLFLNIYILYCIVQAQSFALSVFWDDWI